MPADKEDDVITDFIEDCNHMDIAAIMVSQLVMKAVQFPDKPEKVTAALEQLDIVRDKEKAIRARLEGMIS